MDRFHLKRALNQTLDNGLASEMYEACVNGEMDKVERILMQAQQEATVERAKEVARLRGYLMENSIGLRDYRVEVAGDGLGGLGAIEGNIDKLVANRMKKRGMSWTIKGARRMTRLVNLREMGELHAWITHKDRQRDSKPSRQSRQMAIAKPKPGMTQQAWLEAGLPALSGPHQNRPWCNSCGH